MPARMRLSSNVETTTGAQSRPFVLTSKMVQAGRWATASRGRGARYTELTFPRLQARIQLLEGGTYWLHVWLWEQPGGPRKELMNGKRAGNTHDAHEHLRKLAALTSARIAPTMSPLRMPRIQTETERRPFSGKG